MYYTINKGQHRPRAWLWAFIALVVVCFILEVLFIFRPTYELFWIGFKMTNIQP